MGGMLQNICSAFIQHAQGLDGTRSTRTEQNASCPSAVSDATDPLFKEPPRVMARAAQGKPAWDLHELLRRWVILSFVIFCAAGCASWLYQHTNTAWELDLPAILLTTERFLHPASPRLPQHVPQYFGTSGESLHNRNKRAVQDYQAAILHFLSHRTPPDPDIGFAGFCI